MAKQPKTKEEQDALDSMFGGYNLIKTDKNRSKLPTAAELKKLQEGYKKGVKGLKFSLKKGTPASIKANLLKERPKKNFTQTKRNRTLRKVRGKYIIQ